MQEVEFSKGNEDDACPQVNGFLNEIIDGGEFYFNIVGSMLEFNLRGKFHAIADVPVYEGHQAMLIEATVPLVLSIDVFDVHVPADDGLGAGDEGPSINEVAGPLHG